MFAAEGLTAAKVDAAQQHRAIKDEGEGESVEGEVAISYACLPCDYISGRQWRLAPSFHHFRGERKA